MKLKGINEWHITEGDDVKDETSNEFVKLAKSVEATLQEDDDTIKVKVISMLKNNYAISIVSDSASADEPFELSSADLKAVIAEFKKSGMSVMKYSTKGAAQVIHFKMS